MSKKILYLTRTEIESLLEIKDLDPEIRINQRMLKYEAIGKWSDG